MLILYRKEIHEEIKFDMGKSNTTDTSASLSDKILHFVGTILNYQAREVATTSRASG
jgi:hypothetical protein